MTFDLTSHLDVPSNGFPRKSCIEPAQSPPREIEPADILAFAGYPGYWREHAGPDYLRFYSFSSGTTGIESIAPQYVYAHVSPPDALMQQYESGLLMGSLGGLSGGPVFVWRKTPILIAEFVGLVTEYQESWDLLFIRRSSCIGRDGRLREDQLV